MSVSTSETYSGPRQPNQIEIAIATHFGDPELWSADRDCYLREGWRMAGVSRYENGEIWEPRYTWVAQLQGHKITGHDGKRPQMKVATLETMTAIQHLVSQTVLAGEHARPSVLVDPPIAKIEAISTTRENNLFLLKEIERGVWPVMWLGKWYPDGQKEYYDHDYMDDHNLPSLLLPRETQDLITEVARHERVWITNHSVRKPVPLLTLWTDRYPPFSSIPEPDVEDGYIKNGLEIIDRVTSAEKYVQLLHYLMHGEGDTPEQRLETVKHHLPTDMDEGCYPYSLQLAVKGLKDMRKHTAAMVIFISRHQLGEKATQERVAHEYQNFERGAVRVAKKILGEYDPTQDSPDQTATTWYRRRRTIAGWLSPLLGRLVHQG